MLDAITPCARSIAHHVAAFSALVIEALKESLFFLVFSLSFFLSSSGLGLTRIYL